MLKSKKVGDVLYLEGYRLPIKDSSDAVVGLLHKSYENFKNDLESIQVVIAKTLETIKGIEGRIYVENLRWGDSYNDPYSISPIPLRGDLRIETREHMYRLVNIQFLQLPQIDKSGVMYINGKAKTLQHNMVLARSLQQIIGEKISVIGVDKSFSIVYNKRNLNFVRSRNHKTTLYDLLIKVLGDMGISSVKDFITSNFFNIRIINKLEELQLRSTVVSETKVNECLANKDENLYIDIGYLKEEFNDLLSLKNLARDRVLCDPVDEYQSGTILTSEVLETLDNKGITQIVVKNRAFGLIGYYLTEDFTINKIPRGIRVTNTILRHYPELTGYAYTPKEIHLVPAIHYKKTYVVDQEFLDLIYDLGIESINLKSTKTKKGKRYYFKQTILSTIKSEDTILTPRDILALIITAYNIEELGKQARFLLPNRDTDFLKEVHGFDITFKKCYARALNEVVRTSYRMRDEIKARDSEQIERLFSEVMDKTFYNLNMTKLVQPAEFRNLVSLLSESRRVATKTNNTHSASAGMRDIQHGYKGAIDPWDTPQGRQLGLVNSLSRSVRINENRLLEVPIHRIVQKGDKYYISHKVEYIPTSMRTKLRTAGILDLEFESEIRESIDVFTVPIRNSNIIAEVPNFDPDSSDRITYIDVLSHTLDAVDVYPDQNFSLATSMIPFIGANDGARIQFTDSMIKESIPLIDAEIPRVLTPTYLTLPELAGTLIIAKNSGEVIEASPNKIVIRTDRNEIDEYKLDHRTIRGSNLTLQYPTVRIGEEIEKDKLIAETLMSKKGVYSAGVNAFVAFMMYDGYNFEDGYILSESFSLKTISPAVSTIVKEISYVDKYFKQTGELTKAGTYLAPGDTIFKLHFSDGSLETLKTKMSNSGVLISQGLEESDTINSYQKRVARTFDIKTTEVGDKIVNRHGNKGLSSKILKNSEMPYLKNGIQMDVLNNPLGVEGRMNLGQLFEASAGLVGYLLDIVIITQGGNGISKEEIQLLLSFCYDLANSDKGVNEILNQYKSKVPEEILNRGKERYTYLQSDWSGVFNRDGSAIMIDPLTGEPYAHPIFFGVTYFLKLHHEAHLKQHERGGIKGENVAYTQVYKAPTEGAAVGGGQRFGEMEHWAVEAYGAAELFKEKQNFRADDEYFRYNIENMIPTVRRKLRGLKNENVGATYNRTLPDVSTTRTRSNEVFQMMLETLGIDLEGMANFRGHDYTLTNLTSYINKLDRDEIKRAQYYNNKEKNNKEYTAYQHMVNETEDTYRAADVADYDGINYSQEGMRLESTLVADILFEKLRKGVKAKESRGNKYDGENA